MTFDSSPHCGHDLTTLQRFEIGPLTIIGNSIVTWYGHRVPLTAVERLLVIALGRSAGVLIKMHVLADVIGTEVGDPRRTLDVHFCRIRRKFREIDPAFDKIERDHGRHGAGGVRWVNEVNVPGALRRACASLRAMHKLMLTHPGRSIPEWTHLRGLKSNSTVFQQLKRLEARKLARREQRYQRGWTAVGTLAMHDELERADQSSGPNFSR